MITILCLCTDTAACDRLALQVSSSEFISPMWWWITVAVNYNDFDQDWWLLLPSALVVINGNVQDLLRFSSFKLEFFFMKFLRENSGFFEIFPLVINRRGRRINELANALSFRAVPLNIQSPRCASISRSRNFPRSYRLRRFSLRSSFHEWTQVHLIANTLRITLNTAEDPFSRSR